MIKNINDGEINRLKKGFFNALALKKLELLKINKFISREVNLKTALMIYKILLQLEVKNMFTGYSTIMLEYLLEYEIITPEEYVCFGYFYDDTDDKEWSDEDCILYSDDYDERESFFYKMLKGLCEQRGLGFYYATSMDIFINRDINLNIFGDHQKAFREDILRDEETKNLAEMTAEELEEEYCDYFEDDLLCYAIENYELSTKQIELLNRYLVDCGNFGYPSQVYSKYGNTYIDLSRTLIFESLGKTFLIIFKLIMSEIIK